MLLQTGYASIIFYGSGLTSSAADAEKRHTIYPAGWLFGPESGPAVFRSSPVVLK